MLSLKHFDEYNKDTNGKAWQQLLDEKIVVSCKDCGKLIYAYWYAGELGTMARKEQGPVKRCALCFDYKKEK